MIKRTIKRMDIGMQLGVPMRAILIPAGQTFPNHPMTDMEHDTIEFYDSRHQHTPDGQFITRYDTGTFLEGCTENNKGLILYGGEPDWQINGRTYKLVVEWLSYHLYEGAAH